MPSPETQTGDEVANATTEGVGDHRGSGPSLCTRVSIPCSDTGPGSSVRVQPRCTLDRATGY